MEVRSISAEESEKLYDSEWWIGKTPHEIALGQLSADKCCVPWKVLQKALSEVLGRHISNEDVMRNYEGLRKEFLTVTATKE